MVTMTEERPDCVHMTEPDSCADALAGANSASAAAEATGRVSNDLFDLIITLYKKVFDPAGHIRKMPMPLSHARVLFFLKNSGPAPISHVGRDLMISRPNMTPIIDKLAAEGYVRTFIDPNDRRMTLVEVTERALSMFKEGECGMKHSIGEKLIQLSPAELAELSALIGRMNQIFTGIR